MNPRYFSSSFFRASAWVLLATVGFVHAHAQPGGKDVPAGSRTSEADQQVRPGIPAAKGTMPTLDDANRPVSAADKRARQRDLLVKSVHEGKKAAAEAALELDDGDAAQKNSPESRLEYGQAALKAGMRLTDANKTKEAGEFFSAAEKALVKASREFAKTQTTGRADALYALAYLRANFLNEKVQAFRDLSAALEANPKHAGALATKERLERQYPNIKQAKLPAEVK